MARGWESKSVEAQQEESKAAKSAAAQPALNPEQLQRRRRLGELALSRSRVLQSLESSSNERYSAMLRQALAELDAQIAALQD